MLSDECYIATNHSELLDFPYNDGLITCATGIFFKNRVSLLLHSEGAEKNSDVTINRYMKNGHIYDIFVILSEKNENEQIILATGAQAVLCPPGGFLHRALLAN